MDAASIDRDTLDKLYNLRAAVPEHPEFFARWAAESETVRAKLGGRVDLAYGAAPGERLDLFLPPDADAPVPLLAFIHGGYWRALDKSDFSYLAPPFVAAGVGFASINYTLVPDASLAEIVDQCLAAVAWLWREAPGLGVDRERVFVAGHSAGGHLTACAMGRMAAEYWAAAGVPDDVVKGGCAVSGVFDLEPVRHCYLNDLMQLDATAAARLGPVNDLPVRDGPGGRSPLLLAVGAGETDAFLQQQDAYAGARAQAGLPTQAMVLPGRNHFAAIDALGETDDPLFAAVLGMVLGHARD
jgi:arylformamidase